MLGKRSKQLGFLEADHPLPICLAGRHRPWGSSGTGGRRLSADHLSTKPNLACSDYVGRGSFYGFLASLRGQLFRDGRLLSKTVARTMVADHPWAAELYDTSFPVARTMAGIACRPVWSGHRAVGSGWQAYDKVSDLEACWQA